MFATNYFHGRKLLALYVENVDGVRILSKATVFYALYRTVQYCITLPYSIYFFLGFFFGFVPCTYTTCRGDVCYVRILGYERRGDVGDAVE